MTRIDPQNNCPPTRSHLHSAWRSLRNCSSHAGLITWQDAETGTYSLIDTSSPRVRNALLLQQTKRTEALETLHRRNGIDLIQFILMSPMKRLDLLC